VGGKRAHPELVGPGEGLAVVRRGGFLIRRLGLLGYLTEESENPGLVAALLLAMGEGEGAPDDFERVLSAAGQRMRLVELGEQERVVGRARRRRVGERLLHETHAFPEATPQRVGIAEVSGCDVEEQPHLGDPAHLDGPLERDDGTGGITAAQRDEPQVRFCRAADTISRWPTPGSFSDQDDGGPPRLGRAREAQPHALISLTMPRGSF
jgi:hypothetical protein